ncbi:DDE-type integrase/transposase/recombinase, partial [Actinomadura sp. LOL_011]|uniref:DDE-type integrase/transposase/recombinase n=1 Tax=Actinomadura sp. LOL_011 TaxID=3345410 RepID=UPI003A7FE24C
MAERDHRRPGGPHDHEAVLPGSGRVPLGLLRRPVPAALGAGDQADLAHRPGHTGLRRDGPNRLWVTDITEHPTREGEIYRCVVIDAFSRRVVGWAIDSRQRAAPATGALGLAIDSRGGIRRRDPRRPRHPVHLVGLHRTRPPGRAAPFPGNRWRPLRQRRRRGVPGQ